MESSPRSVSGRPLLIAKSDGGVRPVAIGEVLVCIARLSAVAVLALCWLRCSWAWACLEGRKQWATRCALPRLRTLVR